MNFRIFWIDDSKTWVKSVYSELEDTFKDIGFLPVIKQFEDIEPAKNSILTDYADLILVDCNLPSGRGDQLVHDLRHNRCFAHVLFYSEDANNLSKLNGDDHFLQVTHRKDFSGIIDTVADQAYRNYKHPSFMRGLLLSEFIDLENAMEELIVQCFRSEAGYFRKTIIEEGGESFSLSTKKRYIDRLVKSAKAVNTQTKALLDEVGYVPKQFEDHIMKKRNVLAHAHPQYDQDTGNIMLVSSIATVNFDSNWFQDTRERIHEHKKMFKKILDLDLVNVVNPILT